MCFGLAGCGTEDSGMPYYEPSSPLPLRIGGSEPSSTPTPISEEPQASLDKSEPAIQSTPTSSPEPSETPESTPPAVPKNSRSKPVSPTATPTSIPTPLPTPTPPPTPQATSTPEQSGEILPPSVTSSSNDAASSNEDPAFNKEVTDSEKSAEKVKRAATQGAETQQQERSQNEENDPIVTPYDLTIDKLLVCAKVQDRKPIGCGEEFSLSNTGKVFIWMRVSEVKAPKIIKHVYYWNDEVIATVKLNLEYTSMRTWSQKTFKPDHDGHWKVVITTEDGEMIAVRTWTMTP
jgi:hypothetical protein